MTQRLAPDQWLQAANILKHGGTVAFPTETVYGLGADATRSTSIDAIFRAKGRPSDNPLIVHLHHPDQLDAYCQSIPSLAFELIARFCPGPLTLVLSKKPSIVSSVTAGLDTVAVRFPSHPTAQRILEAADLPIAAPSANRSGSPSATSWQAVLEDLDGHIDAVVCDGAAAIGVESTVLDLSSLRPVILRHGAITLEQLREIEPSVTLHATVASNKVNSPGLRHRHYQPRAQVVLCDAQNDATAQANLSLISNNAAAQEARNAFIGLSEPDSSQRFEMQLRCSDIEEYARSLFDFFRRCDAHDIERIYCERVEEIGLGRAVMDRLRRASESR